MNLSVFTAILDDITAFFKSRTPVTVYIPIIAFLGGWALILASAFGTPLLLAFWGSLPLDLKLLLTAVAVFTILFLAFLASYLRVLVLNLYRGAYWITGWGRSMQLARREEWLVEARRLAQAASELEFIRGLLVSSPARATFRAARALPAFQRLDPDADVVCPPGQAPPAWLQNCYTAAAVTEGATLDENGVRAEPWPGYLRGRVAVAVPAGDAATLLQRPSGAAIGLALRR